jgi:LPPG:FO 2-phospho-L-lactate transferase
MSACVVALSGGVGGGRFLDGLAGALPAGALTAIVNTGDDFEHLGLAISPDLDIVMYTLAGLADVPRGWGIAGDTLGALEMLRRYDAAEAWFQLGDRDLGTHVHRTAALRRGEPLSAITARMCGALGITARVLPMSDQPCRTLVDTRERGTLSFQEWFVRERARLPPLRIHFDAAPAPAPGVLEAIEAATCVLIGPSNPYVSIDPILSLPGVRDAVARRPVFAVSPIVGARAVKGPLAEMIPALAGRPASAAAVAAHFGGLLAGLVLERGDAAPPGLPALATQIVMRDRPDRVRLAREVLDFALAGAAGAA